MDANSYKFENSATTIIFYGFAFKTQYKNILIQTYLILTSKIVGTNVIITLQYTNISNSLIVLSFILIFTFLL